MADPRIDGARLLARLEELSRIGGGGIGVTREAWGPEDVKARTLVAGWMAAAGLDPSVDAATNLVGWRAGTGDRWLATGSHLDTVVEAGHLDGAYGVVAAVEVAAALADHPLRHGLLIAAFANEEGARGTRGMTGSHVIAGCPEDVPTDEVDDDGVTVGDRIRRAGGDPSDLEGAAWDTDALDAFVELHIEQGPVLAAAETTIGVVTGITGRQGLDLVLTGAANHAGTTPMGLRRDALAAAAEVVLAVEQLPADGLVRVATTGHVQATPNVRNVVPGTVHLGVELRDQDADRLDAAMEILDEILEGIAARRGIAIEGTWGQRVHPVACAPAIVDAVRASAADQGRTHLDLPSGAGHDAQVIGRAAPIGMIFVPSADGVSHSPHERSEPEDLIAGAEVLLATLLALDGADP